MSFWRVPSRKENLLSIGILLSSLRFILWAKRTCSEQLVKIDVVFEEFILTIINSFIVKQPSF